jgi:acyl-CoA synthetase (AMP-forming)/AMP-acid ligase II
VLQADSEQLETGILAPSSGGRSIEMVSCGEVMPWGTLAIVDPESGTRLEDGRVGEIWFASPTVARGYWKNPEATAETFGIKLAGDDHDYLRTGDLGALIDGELFITGRLKDLIIIRGRNLYPQDLEVAATRVHPAIGMGAAFELAGRDAEVAILLEYDAERLSDDATLDRLARDVRTTLVREFSLPTVAVGFLATGDVPRTANGKVRRALSKTMMERGEFDLVLADGFATAPAL